MSINEAELLQAGFTSADLQKLRKYIIKDELTLSMVISDLSKRFQAALMLTVGVIITFILTLFMASLDGIISMGIALLAGLVIIWILQPPVLSYKSWIFKKNH
ncbi:hypothetical protein ACTZGB_11990 [Yersinia bercovieri]|uniref:Uncharacterized protein n=1 Tax=Yersinia bercovieri TaxID=634 RepID=A0A2G4U276_YERBE|nr:MULTISPECIES: hypothetical protein [Yersinia]MBS0057113.1 hypothetical protein [Yersinia sp. Marseille-Q3913]MCB5301721.1 hypothetical protein [Yersinia bercovieri]MDN0102959.1 hypothetical protein [Yersinia bercovieri]PHZ27425.1 hypothetical protein CS533_10880 [Yersinia bercovieri]QDW34268.1 hypothetical protein FFE93_015175 [Yersinia sp. KBS0713]